MRKLLCLLLCSMFFVGCNMPSTRESELGSYLIKISNNSSATEIAQEVEPAIVGINGIYSSGESVGSGVCVASNGYILTNSHVVSGAKSIVLHMSDKKTATASIVYDNPVSDLAIVKSSYAIPYLSLGDSSVLQVGEDVLAVGTPLTLSLTHTFTKGIVSALNRTLKVDSSSGEGYMQNLIQHDASLNPGNSGGPLLNSRGEIVGINTLKISTGEGIGFAIPSSSFATLLESYVEDESYSLPYLGVYGLDSEIASYYNKTDCEEGFYVIDVAETSPLQECGITKNCVITELNGRKIKNAVDLKNELYKYISEDSISIEFKKGNATYKTKTFLKDKTKLR